MTLACFWDGWVVQPFAHTSKKGWFQPDWCCLQWCWAFFCVWFWAVLACGNTSWGWRLAAIARSVTCGVCSVPVSEFEDVPYGNGLRASANPLGVCHTCSVICSMWASWSECCRVLMPCVQPSWIWLARQVMASFMSDCVIESFLVVVWGWRFHSMCWAYGTSTGFLLKSGLAYMICMHETVRSDTYVLVANDNTWLWIKLYEFGTDIWCCDKWEKIVVIRKVADSGTEMDDGPEEQKHRELWHLDLPLLRNLNLSYGSQRRSSILLEISRVFIYTL